MPSVSVPTRKVKNKIKQRPQVAKDYVQQAERLGQYTAKQESDDTGSTRAVEAKFVTPQDPIIETANGGRLPAVPLNEAVKLNKLKDTLEGRDLSANVPVKSGTREAKDGTIHGARPSDVSASEQSSAPEAPLRQSVPPARTNPLFPPLPLWGPPTILRSAQCWFFRATSFFLSLGFLLVVILGAAATSLPLMFEHVRLRLLCKEPDARRPFHEQEKRRKQARWQAARHWAKRRKGTQSPASEEREIECKGHRPDFLPTEGGSDPLVDDVSYYARRVGLDVESFDVETEDGFIIELWHVYNPREYNPQSKRRRQLHGPEVFVNSSNDSFYGEAERPFETGNKKYPVLMIHGLLQSSGAYCCTDDNSLAFYLAKSGYDVWLGNNRCGPKPRHTLLNYSDPRMWAWNIRQMGVLDLPALISRVLGETGFPKLGLIAHSQGTTQTLVALAKEQRPDLGEKISVFCALAPAAYAGPLIGKAYFKFMRVIGPAMFRCTFGIHAFIPFMMTMHKVLPAKLYGAMGYRVFSFLFNWSDTRWELDLRDRMFQFAPVYVSAESMRWWLGRECFAKQKCILATREEGRMEDEEDEEDDEVIRRYYEGDAQTNPTSRDRSESEMDTGAGGGYNKDEEKSDLPKHVDDEERGKYAWYDEQFPPLALWVCGADDLVDGRRLLRRFDRGREPHVTVVHKKIIEGYEHLDVIWAMDCIEKVGKEVKEVIWRTASEDARKLCRTPTECEDVVREEASGGKREEIRGSEEAVHDDDDCYQHADGITTPPDTGEPPRAMKSPISPTLVDSTSGQWADAFREDMKEAQGGGPADVEPQSEVGDV